MTVEQALKIEQNWTAEQARNDLERLLLTGERPANKVVAMAVKALEKQIPKKEQTHMEENQQLHENDLIFYGTKDIARMLGCSIPTARELMRRPDFPLISTGKNMKVLKSALEQWAMERRTQPKQEGRYHY